MLGIRLEVAPLPRALGVSALHLFVLEGVHS